ncbi:MAG: glycosyltransferase family 39 protein [Phormidesmis sp.]
MGRAYKATTAQANSDRFSLGGLLLAGLVFRTTVAAFLPPGFDEAYYFLYTQHLAWSYFDHPLAVAFSTGVGVWLMGMVSPLTIRLGALVLFTGSVWLLYETGRWLFGPRAGWLSGAIASFCPLFFLTFGTLTAPDNALIFFWTGALYLSAREFFPGDDYRPTFKLALISLLVGLACLSKYHGALLGLGLILFCLTSRTHRAALRSRWMGLGLVLFSLTLLPIFYWNAQHDWISFGFQLRDRFNTPSTSYSFSNFLGVLLAQLGFLFPTLGIPLWWISIKTLISRTSQPIRFVLWCGFPVAAGFTLLGGLAHTYPAWPAPGLWTLTLLLGRAAADWPRLQARQWLQSTGLVVSALLLIALSHITLGTLQKSGQYAMLGGFVAVEQDPSTALINTQQLRRQFEQSEEFWDAIAHTDFLLTNEFWLSGYIAMALPTSVHLPTTCFSQDPRGHAFWFNPQNWLGKNALIISLSDFSQSSLSDSTGPYFRSITPITKITTQRGQAVTETFYLYSAKTLIRAYVYPY